MRQNTQAIQAQTRDSITEKQMEFYGWMATSRDLAEAWVRALAGANADPADLRLVQSYLDGVFREWENSHYQYERGLFTEQEFEARVGRWRQSLASPGFEQYWADQREVFAPSFRAEIDRIVAEVEQAQ